VKKLFSGSDAACNPTNSKDSRPNEPPSPQTDADNRRQGPIRPATRRLGESAALRAPQPFFHRAAIACFGPAGRGAERQGQRNAKQAAVRLRKSAFVCGKK